MLPYKGPVTEIIPHQGFEPPHIAQQLPACFQRVFQIFPFEMKAERRWSRGCLTRTLKVLLCSAENGDGGKRAAL